MTVLKGSAALKAGGKSFFWHAVVALEAVAAALCLARLAFGPISQASLPLLWLLGAALFLAIYLALNLPSALMLASATSRGDGLSWRLLYLPTVPFLAVFLLGLILCQFSPDLANGIWMVLSPIAPFPLLAAGLALLLVLLLKLLAATSSLPAEGPDRLQALRVSSSVAVPAALLLMGALQASVYVTPIGNAFLRYWAIADAAASGVGYPVTLTEPQPMAAGSPPHVYDLPLFPLMLRASFAVFGHNSAAAHLPAAFFSALFPLSLYLLIKRATGSGVVGVLFATLASLFPYLRFWVLNLPDPDPLLLTSGCLAAYFYLRALEEAQGTRHKAQGTSNRAPGARHKESVHSPSPIHHSLFPIPRSLLAARCSLSWVLAGLFCGVLALARPEGILYSGFFALGLLLSRPRPKQLGAFLLSLGLFLVPMVYAWWANFGFLWPQNYNRTLRIDYPLRTYDVLEGMGALSQYARGLGLEEGPALGLLLLFLASVGLGVLWMAARDRRLLAFAIPGIGNSVLVFFTSPYISNAHHFSDFFRHASFGIPFLVATSAYGLQMAYHRLVARPRLKLAARIGVLLLAAAIIREGDILANPTVTHRPDNGWPPPTQALVTYVHLSLEDILRHPLTLPLMSYQQKDGVTVAYPIFMKWPEDGLAFFQPMDMTYQRAGQPFGYASLMAFLLALSFACLDRRGRP